MNRPGLPARKLLFGPRAPERIFFHGRWAGSDHNPRYTQLLPRLRRLDSYLIPVSERRLVRALQTRLLAVTNRVRYRLVFAAANRRYRNMFATDYRQLAFFKGSVVVDVDDPNFGPEQVRLLNRPNVRAFVVTTEAARSRFEQLGVATPAHVISQGIDLRGLDERETKAVGARHRRPGELVVGYLARWLLADPDRKGDHPLDGIVHLLELWDRIRVRTPAARLWLIGSADKVAREICAERPDMLLLGRIPQDQVLSYVANFDIALYPRRVDHAPMPVKLVEYIAMGVPTVSYDLQLAQILGETGTGRLADSPEEFVDQVEALARDEAERKRIATAGRRLGPTFDWESLANRYQSEILDRYLR